MLLSGNGVVEHVNDTFDKKFFRTERFASPTELIDRYDAWSDLPQRQPP